MLYSHSYRPNARFQDAAGALHPYTAGLSAMVGIHMRQLAHACHAQSSGLNPLAAASLICFPADTIVPIFMAGLWLPVLAGGSIRHDRWMLLPPTHVNTMDKTERCWPGLEALLPVVILST